MEKGPVELRVVAEDDLPLLFAYQGDHEARWMAAFTAKDAPDWPAFQARWQRILANETIVPRVIVARGGVVGDIASFVEDESGERHLTYWIGRDYWGQGIATAAVSAFLAQIPARPLHARAAKDNIGSLRVLQKCGFQIVGEDRGFAQARECEVEEFVLRLDAEGAELADAGER